MQKLKKTTEVVEPKEWSKEYLDYVQEFIKVENEEESSIQKLKSKMFALSRKMKHYLRSEEVTEIQTTGDFLQKYMSAFKKFEGITQKQLAEYWGVSTSNLRKYVTGERPLSPTLIYKMATTFETSPKLWLDIQSKNQLFKKFFLYYII